MTEALAAQKMTSADCSLSPSTFNVAAGNNAIFCKMSFIAMWQQGVAYRAFQNEDRFCVHAHSPGNDITLKIDLKDITAFTLKLKNLGLDIHAKMPRVSYTDMNGKTEPCSTPMQAIRVVRGMSL